MPLTESRNRHPAAAQPQKGDDGAMGTNLFYGADQAQLYHDDFRRAAESAGQHLVGQLRAAGLRGGTVVDLGCGTGVLARVVSEAGYDVIGVDISADMIDLAGKEAPLAEFWCGSVLEATIPTAVAVTATGEVINHAADRRAGYTALRDLTGRVADALVPGGIFLFDLATHQPDGTVETRRRWHDSEDWTRHVEEHEDATDHILDRHITIFRRTGPDSYRRVNERHILRLFEADAVLGELTTAGLAAEMLDGYPSDRPVPLPANVAVFRARKPPAA
jgi:SAM-dependent methyltransferase